MELKRTKKQIILIIIIAVLLVGLCGLLLYLNKVNHYKKTIATIQISALDLTKVADGVYTGEFDADMVGAKVKVTVLAGKITAIQLLEHKNDRGASAEPITKAIIAQQKIEVDCIAGATNSSKVIQKSIESACKKGLQE